jgi:hypothetical protein
MSPPDRPTLVNRNANRAAGVALQPGDDRDRALPHAPDHLAGHPGERQQFVLAHGQRGTDDLVHVPARAERPAGAAQHQYPDVPAVRQLGQQIPQVGVGVEGERVQLVRPVQCDGGDPVGGFEPEMPPLLRQRDRSAKRAHQRTSARHDISVH